MLKPLPKFPPVFIAILHQCLACVMLFIGLRQFGLHVSLLQFALAGGFFAAIFSYLSGLARWWLPIQLMFIPGLALALMLSLPPIYYLIAFLVLLAVYWSTFHTQVPLYLSSHQVWHALEELLPPDRQFSFMDIGSGLGGVLTHLARVRPQGKYHGVELAPLPFLISRLRLKLRRTQNVEVHWGNYWTINLGQFDVVFAYLSPVPMEKLWHKVRKEMRPGTLFISNTFIVPDHPPEKQISLKDMHSSTLYVWRM
jgi:precorrin-6B methylase 2